MRRFIQLFIRYKSTIRDETVSRFVPIHISEIPYDMRKKYEDTRNLEIIIRWVMKRRYNESDIEILNISVLTPLDDFICNSI